MKTKEEEFDYSKYFRQLSKEDQSAFCAFLGQGGWINKRNKTLVSNQWTAYRKKNKNKKPKNDANNKGINPDI